MNKHIVLVKKWLANPKSVTQEELLANEDAAFSAVANASAYVPDSAYAAAAYASYYAVKASKTTNSTDVQYWLTRYEELTE